jgi:hypothetical protein
MPPRVSRFADCRRVSMPEPSVNCASTPRCRSDEGLSPWNKQSPLSDLEVPPSEDEYEIVGSFNRRMIQRKPLDYAPLVAVDLAAFSSYGNPHRERQPVASRAGSSSSD